MCAEVGMAKTRGNLANDKPTFSAGGRVGNTLWRRVGIQLRARVPALPEKCAQCGKSGCPFVEATAKVVA